MSTGQGGAAETVPTADAVGYIRDVLAQAVDPEEVAWQLKLVGPLDGDVERGERLCLFGCVGWVKADRNAPSTTWYRWHTTVLAYHGADIPDGMGVHGEEPTREAADRALCAALRELGWTVLGVPA